MADDYVLQRYTMLLEQGDLLQPHSAETGVGRNGQAGGMVS
ncbi:Uncharacterised protein [Yersinia enterocolitica]|nr:Uncharacterised protein [Yersinia enterocolitica]